MYSYNYKKEFFQRPLFNELNVLFLKFLTFSALLLIPLTIAYVSYYNQFPQQHLDYKIRQNYLSRIVKLYKNAKQPLYASINMGPGLFIPEMDEHPDDFLEDSPVFKREVEIISKTRQLPQGPAKSFDQSLAAFLKSPSQTKVDVQSAIDRIPTVATPAPTRTLSLVEPYQTRKQAYESNIKKFNKMESGKVTIPEATFTDFGVVQGVRKYEETITIVNENNHNLKYCFRRILRNDPTAHGFIQLQFSIHPEGYVIRNSVKVLNTNIRDRRVVQCVTRSVSRWRNFPQVPYENGEYSVTQKYIF